MADLVERLQPHLSDRYQFERELGRGGMATVFLARDIKHDREVAIKVLHPELSASIGSERFEREIKLAAKLQHPHILGMYDSGQSDGLLYYVMPFVKGESLRDRLDREGQLPIEDAIQFTLEVCDALGHAHSQGIIHRDIKPENVLVSNGHALVADFGIARAAQEAGGNKLTQTGMAIGTPVYMSPEQAAGDAVGPTSDLYSLGCMLYELLAGEPPFTAKNPMALMARHAMEAVPSIRIVRNTVPEEVEDAIFASMAKVPADRPKDAAHFAELLGAPLGSTITRRASIRQTASRRVPTGMHRMAPPLPWWRKPIVVAAAVAVVVAGSFATWRVMRGAGPARGAVAVDSLTKRVAVLYFTDLSRDHQLQPVADGLTEALIGALSAVPTLHVVSRNGMAPYRNPDIAKDSVARAVGAGTLVVGSVEPEGKDRVRVSTRLFDRDGSDIGKRANFVVSRDSLFTAGASVAQEVARSLRAALGDEVRLQETQSGTRSLAAWNLLNRAEKGRKTALEVSDTNPARGAALLLRSDSLLQQAETDDPGWIDPALLRGDIAYSLAQLEDTKDARAKWVARGMTDAEYALSLDPQSAQAQALRGTLRYAQWRLATPDAIGRKTLLEDARKDLEGAVAKDGSLASAYATLSQLYYNKQDVTSAFGMARSAYAADAFLANADGILLRLFWTSYDQQLFSEADKWCTEGNRRFPRDYNFTICRLWLQLNPNATPDISEAWKLAARTDSLLPVKERVMQSHLTKMLVGGIIGRAARSKSGGVAQGPLADSAEAVIKSARVDAQVDPEQEMMGYEALVRAQMGQTDQAIKLLKRYVVLNPDHSFEVNDNVHWWWRELVNQPGFSEVRAQHR